MCTDTLKQQASRWCGCLWRWCFSFSIYLSCRQSSCQQLQLRGAVFWEDTEWNTYSLAKQGRAGNKNHSAVWNCSVFEEGRGIIYHIMKRHNEKDDKGIVMLNRGKLSCCRVFFMVCKTPSAGRQMKLYCFSTQKELWQALSPNECGTYWIRQLNSFFKSLLPFHGKRNL